MQDESSKLSLKQQQGIAALLSNGGDIKKAAKTAGVNECTFHRWLKDEHFSKAVKDARALVWNNTLESLKSASNEAIQTLKKNLKAKSATVQNQAARAILEFSIRAVQTIEHEQRLADLETALEIYKVNKK